MENYLGKELLVYALGSFVNTSMNNPICALLNKMFFVNFEYNAGITLLYNMWNFRQKVASFTISGSSVDYVANLS